MAIDKRVIKTKTGVKNAFMSLILEKELSKITVSDIAERANINRSTFYLHYDSVLSVMQDIEREIAYRITSHIDRFDVSDIYQSTYKMFMSLNDTLEKMDNIRKYILNSTNSNYVTSRLKAIFVEKASAALIKDYPDLTDRDIRYPLIFAAGGVCDSYLNWMNSEYKSITLEQLITIVSAQTEKIIESVKPV